MLWFESKEELNEYMVGEREIWQDENNWDDSFEVILSAYPGERSEPRDVLTDRVVIDIPDGVGLEEQ